MQENQLQVNLKDYEQFYNYAERKGYSGTAIFSKVKPINVSNGIGKEEHDLEGRVITLEFEKFFLVNCYTPNSRKRTCKTKIQNDLGRGIYEISQKTR